MLTGESSAVIKQAIQKDLENKDFNDFDQIKKHTIFSGTKIIQARSSDENKVYGLVIRTGFVTAKGGLVREILFPQKVKQSFYRDSLIFVGIMIFVFIIAFASIIQMLINTGFSS